MRLFLKILLLPVAALLMFHAFVYGAVLNFRAVAPPVTVFMMSRMQAVRAVRPDVVRNYRWIPYDRISVNLKRALIASEDARFAAHDGFDWNGIRRALKQNERAGEVRSGGSTISQQLAKNLFLTPERSYLRKGEEAYITAVLESVTDKDRIFALYLNVIEWGYGVFGAEAAAQKYFGISASALNVRQAARLAAMVPRPLYYADHPKDAALRKKTNIILRRMGSAELPEGE